MAVVYGRRSIRDLFLDRLYHEAAVRIRARARRNGDFTGIAVPVDDLIGIRVMATGRWELTALDAIRTLLAGSRKFPGINYSTFVDVGANIGLYSIALSKYFDRTIAFEANPVTFKVLEANLLLSGMRTIKAHCVGVSSEKKQANFYMPSDGNLGWGTLSASRHGEDAQAVPITIELDTLDNLSHALGFDSNPVSLLKVDVEGHEAEVLRGAVGILKKWAPIVLFEVLAGTAGQESLAILQECGYSRYSTFRRKITLSGIFRGLPTVIEDYDISNPKPAALVCAAKGSSI